MKQEDRRPLVRIGGLLACNLWLWLAACGGDHLMPAPDAPTPLPVTGAARPTTPSKPAAAEAPTDELLVTFRPEVAESRRQAIHQSVGCRVIGRMLSGRIAHVKLPRGKTIEEIQSAYQAYPEVEAAEPNAPVQTQDHDRPTR